MIPRTGTIDVYEDRLVQSWRERETGRKGKRGKRVSRDCPLAREEIRAYVKGDGAVSCIKAIRDHRGMSLQEAWDVWKQVQQWMNGCERAVFREGQCEWRKRYEWDRMTGRRGSVA